MLQETKCGALDLPSEIKNFPDYHTYFQHTNDRDGYAGVGLLSKKKPLNVSFGLGIEKFDSEGRLITAEFDEFYLIGACKTLRGFFYFLLNFVLDLYS